MRGDLRAARRRLCLDHLIDADVDALGPADAVDLDLALRGGFPEPALRLDEAARRPWLDSYAEQLNRPRPFCGCDPSERLSTGLGACPTEQNDMIRAALRERGIEHLQVVDPLGEHDAVPPAGVRVISSSTIWTLGAWSAARVLVDRGDASGYGQVGVAGVPLRVGVDV